MAVIESYLGDVTAYADARKHGYTGTREEFGEQQAKAGISAALVAENRIAADAAKDSAIAAKTAAETAQEKAETAKAAAESSADRAEQAILTNGYAEFHIENGRLMLSRTSSITNKLDFQMTKGRLEALIYG